MELRLNKIISDSGLCSRREADKFIEMGRVTVNGKRPEVGQKISEQDVVMVDGFQIDVNDHSKEGMTRISGKTKNLMFGDKPLKRDDLIANRENAEREKAEWKPSDRKPIDRKPADKKPTDPKPTDRKPTDRKPTDRKPTDRKPTDRKPTDGKPFDKKSTLHKPVVRKSAGWEEGEDEVKFEKRPGKFVKYNKYAAARHAARDGEKPKSYSASKVKAEEDRLLKEAQSPKFGKSLSRSAVAQRMGAAPKSASLRKTSKNNPVNKAKYSAGRNKPKEE